MKITLIPITEIQNSDYLENSEKSDENYKDGFLQCPICGKNTDWDKSAKAGRVLHMVEGGAFLTDAETKNHDNDGSDMGWFPVGATCWKKWLAMKKSGKYEQETEMENFEA